MADTYAIVESGGKQYRAEKGGTLLVDRLPATRAPRSACARSCSAATRTSCSTADDLEKVKVEAKVAGHERGEKIRVFKYGPRRAIASAPGHRSELTRLEVTEVKMLTRKPAAPKAERRADEGRGRAEGAGAARRSPRRSRPRRSPRREEARRGEEAGREEARGARSPRRRSRAKKED